MDQHSPLGRALDAEAAARRLGVSPSTVRRLCRAGVLRWVNVGLGPVNPRYRIHESAILDFLESREEAEQKNEQSVHAPSKRILR